MVKDGIVLGKRYAVLSKIGAGGMADVYKGRDQMLNRYVAIKVLKKQYKEDENFVRKFRSEAQAAAGLMHPNIVNVYDVGEDRGLNYMVMELVEGITLKEYIERKGRLSHKETISIAIQMCSGIGAAHASGIIHRDIKPQNIIISKDGKVKVTDFGIAKAVTSNTVSTNAMGSVHYTSPEQARGGFSDQRSDIYSIGITLFEMVTGQVPFDGETTVEVAMKHLQQEITPPSELVPDIPYSLEQIILKCTQKSVDRRYQNMEDVIADLKHSLIDPQGDFVTLTSVDNEAKTVVISDKELGEIKHMPKQIAKSEPEALEEEINETDYDDEPEEKSRRKKSGKTEKKKKGGGHGLTIAVLLLGVVILIAIILVAGKASGLLGSKSQTETKTETTDTPKTDDDGMVTVPNLVGKTEDEAKNITKDMKLGIQPMGEEASTQAKGTISSQDIPQGSKVEQYTTIKYYISKGAQQITVPDVDGQTGVDAQQTLEDMGLTVNVQKEYSELNDDGTPLVDPGYAYSTTPDAGASVSAGDTVTLVVSRGVDYGDSVEVPSVVGMTKNDAVTTFGKFLNVEVKEERSTDVAAGEVISQEPEAGNWEDPDTVNVVITVSTGDQDPASVQNTDTANAAGTSDSAAQTTDTASTDNSAAVAAGEVWKCTQTLNTPAGYTGGPVRLELIQNVNGTPTASVVLQDQVIQFPYDLDITGAPGISEGTLYLSEQINGTYQELGNYSITFAKAE